MSTQLDRLSAFKLHFLWVLMALLLSVTVSAQDRTQDRLRDDRARMVQESLVREGISNQRVLQSMTTVPRHEFVPLGPLQKQAYWDMALAIGHQQTISPPYVVAYMTESIDPQPTDRVLEIGTGSGYQAAVLSGLVKDVFTIEIVAPLGKEAERRLQKLGYKNVTCKIGDGYLGWAEHAPFDKIIVTCSPENVPVPLVEQLREGGKMIVPLGERYQQVFHLFEKRNGQLKQTRLIPTLFVPMTGKSEELRAVKPDPANPAIVNGSFEKDENKDEIADHWHYQRQAQRTKDDSRDGDFVVVFENNDPGRLSQMLQGFALDGRKIASINLQLDVKIDSVQLTNQSHEKPSMLIYFYDHIRRQIGESTIGPFTRKADWERIGRRIEVPKEAREAIVRVGLNGATGRMVIDNVKLSFAQRP